VPHRFIERFNVRHYEVDAYGHLNNAVYLNYMEETAIRASADMGFALSDYASMGKVWLIYASEIEYLQPITYDNEVQVETWVANAGAVSCIRRYDFQIADSPAARATTQWVFMDTQKSKPSRIPPDFMQAVFPEGTPASPFERLPFPKPLDPPGTVFSIRKRVEWRDIDPNQHLNNAAYMAYAEDCAVAVGKAFGWPTDVALERGYAFFIRQNRLRYLHPAYLGDELEISTWLVEVKRSSVRRHYDLWRLSDEVLLAQVQTLWITVDPESGKPIRMSPQILNDFSENIAEGAMKK
jgi:acyl-CoA thioester hydrolase